MRTLGNVLWHFPFLGFLAAAIYWLLGALLTVTIVAAPIGLGLMEFGKFLLAPFGRAMISGSNIETKQNSAWKTYSTIVMILYLPIGIILAVLSIIQVVLLCFTIVGIPVAIVVAKSLGTALNPVNKKCVTIAMRDELERRNASSTLDNFNRK